MTPQEYRNALATLTDETVGMPATVKGRPQAERLEDARLVLSAIHSLSEYASALVADGRNRTPYT